MAKREAALELDGAKAPVQQRGVLFLLDSAGLGGTELFTLRLIRALRAAGVPASICLMRAEGPLLSDFEQHAAQVYALSGAGTRFALFKLGWQFRQLVQRLRPYAVVGQNAGAGVLVGLAVRKTDVRVRVVAKRWERVRKRPLNALWYAAVRRVDVLYSNTPDLAELSEIVAGRSVGVAYLPNIVEAAMFEQCDEEPCGGTMARNAEILRIVVAGRLVHDKGQDLAVEAAAELVRRGNRKFRLVLKGDGEMREQLMRQARALAVEEYVQFDGGFRCPPNPFIGADVALLPSRTEGLPNALIEALAVGVPVVATSVGGVPAVARHLGAGVHLCPPEPKQLAASLLSVADTLHHATQCAALMQARVAREHMPDAVASRFVHLALGESGVQ